MRRNAVFTCKITHAHLHKLLQRPTSFVGLASIFPIRLVMHLGGTFELCTNNERQLDFILAEVLGIEIEIAAIEGVIDLKPKVPKKAVRFNVYEAHRLMPAWDRVLPVVLREFLGISLIFWAEGDLFHIEIISETENAPQTTWIHTFFNELSEK